ncbi:alkaline phosphatase [Pseudohyphozyma bogoriensis]|nr:alkaline phosphatase [Pseudohyphozyma bogoriensis]
MVSKSFTILTVAAAFASCVSAQTYRRTGACPSLGCIFPPDQTEFLAGQVFDIRIEVQAPVNGTQAFNNGVPNQDYYLEIGGDGGERYEVAEFYGIEDPKQESYNFTYYEDLFAKDAKTPTVVNVLAKSYRHITLYNPGKYTLKLHYNGGMETIAHWTVKEVADCKKAKNLILFVGDGMSSSMVTAARLLGHKSINGKYQSTMAMDKAPAFGMQMTHSIDSYITDSANSATALMAGKKATVNGLNAYTDSTGKPLNNPKFETIFEMARRIYNAKVGIVSTAYLADATPAAVVAHTSQRSQYDFIIDQFLDGVTANYSWTKWDGPDVLFGGGGSDFLAKVSNGNVSKIAKFQDKGYEFVTDNSSLNAIGNDKRALGLFAGSTMPTWLDRHVYKANLATFPQYNNTKGVYDSPGLKEMTLKAIDILSTRAKADGTGWVMMSEAASIDKAMHIADYDRALGELLELDDTLAATLKHLEDIGELEETLIILTADHGHGFDVFGSSDSKYMIAQTTNSTKKNAVGTYQNSGLSEYQVAPGQLADNHTIVYGENGPGFPVQWTPRYTAAMGLVDYVDRNEDYMVHNSSRVTSILDRNTSTYYVNPEDSSSGFFVGGNLPTSGDQGVHSLTDVPVYAWGPGSEFFRGIQNSPDIAFHIGLALDLGKTKNVTYGAQRVKLAL